MNRSTRPLGFWVIMVFLSLDLLFFLAGQTASLFAYDFTVRMGLQESVDAVGAHGIQVNRSFGLADTFVGVPLMIGSIIGLLLRRTWALTALAAFAGMTLYWPAACSGLLLFLPGVPGYHLVPPPGYWLLFGLHIGWAVWAILYIILRGETLVLR
jgi:hypothetical protein